MSRLKCSTGLKVLAVVSVLSVGVAREVQAITVYENNPYATNEALAAVNYGFVNVGPNPEVGTGDRSVHAQLFDVTGFDTITTFSVDLHPFALGGLPDPGDVTWEIYEVTAFPGGFANATLGTSPLLTGTFSPTVMNAVDVYTANNLNLSTAGVATNALALVLSLPDQGLSGEIGWQWESSDVDTDVTGLGAHYSNSSLQSTGWKRHDTIRDLALYVVGIPSTTGGGPAVPEPGALGLLVLAALGLLAVRYRRA